MRCANACCHEFCERLSRSATTAPPVPSGASPAQFTPSVELEALTPPEVQSGAPAGENRWMNALNEGGTNAVKPTSAPPAASEHTCENSGFVVVGGIPRATPSGPQSSTPVAATRCTWMSEKPVRSSDQDTSAPPAPSLAATIQFS